MSNLYELKERLIAPRQTFAQIWQVEGYRQFKIRGSIINVLANVNITQSILPCMLNDEATIGVILKHRLEYKSPYLSRNIQSNQVMVALRNLVKTPLYINAKLSVRPIGKTCLTLQKFNKVKLISTRNKIIHETKFI
jgi:hypothetical protein